VSNINDRSSAPVALINGQQITLRTIFQRQKLAEYSFVRRMLICHLDCSLPLPEPRISVLRKSDGREILPLIEKDRRFPDSYIIDVAVTYNRFLEIKIFISCGFKMSQ
jgi:hypothetical protein